jgi:hypothetical protein
MSDVEEIKKADIVGYLVTHKATNEIRLQEKPLDDLPYNRQRFEWEPLVRASTLEALQRENEEQKAWIKTATLEITKAIGGGSEMFTQHGDDFRVDPAFVASFIQFRRERHAEAQKSSVRKAKKLREALEPFATVSRDWVDDGGWTELACKNDRIVDWFGATDFLRARTALASAGEEHHAE